MQILFSDDRTRLIISADPQEREALRAREDIQSDNALHEVFEPLVCNSELEWGQPWVTGDLTDAPLLWITGEDVTMHKIPRDAIGTMFIGRRGEPPELCYTPVLERWAYMDYQVRSPLEDLRDRGEVIFIGGK